MLKYCKPEQIVTTDIQISGIEASEQRWCNKSEYTGYITSYRKKCGLIVICSDIVAVFDTASGGRITAHKNDIVYIPSGCRYRASFYTNAPDRGTDSYTVNFILKSGEDELLFSDAPMILINNYKPEIQNTLRELSMVAHDITVNRLKEKMLFLLFFESVISSVAEKSDGYYPIRKGVALLNKNWNHNERISVYADVCGISESYFNRLFRAKFNISPVEYRNRIRISHAKSLLKNSTLTISEIASLTGFNDPFYFSRLFKKSVGKSPSQFK